MGRLAGAKLSFPRQKRARPERNRTGDRGPCLQGSPRQVGQMPTHVRLDEHLKNFLTSPIIETAAPDAIKNLGARKKPLALPQPHSTPGLAPLLTLAVGPFGQLAVGEACQHLRQVHGPMRRHRQVAGRRTVGDETRLGRPGAAWSCAFLLAFVLACGRANHGLELSFALTSFAALDRRHTQWCGTITALLILCWFFQANSLAHFLALMRPPKD